MSIRDKSAACICYEVYMEGTRVYAGNCNFIYKTSRSRWAVNDAIAHIKKHVNDDQAQILVVGVFKL